MIDSLYKKKIIRDFLSLFTENHWKSLIACLVEYAILRFKKEFNIVSMTAEEVISVIENIKKSENIVEYKKPVVKYKEPTKTNKAYTRPNSTKPRNDNKVTNVNVSFNPKAIKRDISNKSILNKTNKLTTRENSTNNSNTSATKSKTITQIKKKNTAEILEQINLNKLKEKINKIKTLEKPASKSVAKKKQFGQVESRIKSHIENDKKIYNAVRAIGITDNYTNTKENTINNTNSNLYTYKYSNDYSESPCVKNTSNIISLEDRLNGLTMKLSNMENKSKLK
jgi:hypothetical protein